MKSIKDMLGTIVSLPGNLTGPADEIMACGVLSLPGAPKPGVIYCDTMSHVRVEAECGWEHVEECPTVRKKRVAGRLENEKRRLSGEVYRIASHGGVVEGTVVFDGYDASRHDGAAKALATMQEFAKGPKRNVLLVSPAGLGKTRLLLASHFALIKSGIASQYVTTPELRKWFKRANSYDDEVAREAQAHLDRYMYAQAVHFDDAGHIENDQRARGEFAEGLKDLLDRSRAMWAVATNRSSEEMERHPDLSGTIVSRFQYDADVVVMKGDDFRTETAR